MIALDDFIYDGTKPFEFGAYPTRADVHKKERKQYEAKLADNVQRISQLQDKLYAEGREGVVLIVQAMDAAGKDGTIKHVLTGVNPAGVKVANFKSPSSKELAHDYLWRCVAELPERGMIGVFNRSYYEDVLIVRVIDLWKSYKWPKRCCDMSKEEFFNRRYRQINNFEQYLNENGYRVIKIFLNVGRDEQAKRFLSRIDEQEKNWKFSAGDLKTRSQWDEYMEAFDAAISSTSTESAPWILVPADQKWVARYLVSEALLRTLEDIDPQYPQMSDEDAQQMSVCRQQLLVELGEDEPAEIAEE